MALYISKRVSSVRVDGAIYDFVVGEVAVFAIEHQTPEVDTRDLYIRKRRLGRHLGLDSRKE
jgi:hypothetical protein